MRKGYDHTHNTYFKCYADNSVLVDVYVLVIVQPCAKVYSVFNGVYVQYGAPFCTKQSYYFGATC